MKISAILWTPCLYRLLKLISYTSTLKIKIWNFWFFRKNRWLSWLVMVTLFLGFFMGYSILGIPFDLVQNKKFELLKITNFMLLGIYLAPGCKFFFRKLHTFIQNGILYKIKPFSVVSQDIDGVYLTAVFRDLSHFFDFLKFWRKIIYCSRWLWLHYL